MAGDFTVNHATHSHHISEISKCAECRKINKQFKEDTEKFNKAHHKIFDFPIKTFDPSNLMQEMINADDGQVFVLDQKSTMQLSGDYLTELTIAQIKKVKSI